MPLYKLFHPEIFQGSLKAKDYFEGWYFKHVSADLEHAMAFIPGISLSANDPHAFIQYIDGINRTSAYFRFDIESFKYEKKFFRVKIGASEFSENQIHLNLENNEFNIAGTLNYSGNVRLPKNILMPGIMGWYSYVPKMECNHGVVSIHHLIEGRLSINGSVKDFTDGNGYIEKDWGTSFPESWIWLQCNNFSTKGMSLMVSVAKIPWRGRFFIGLISFLTTGGKTEVFATYNGAKIQSLEKLNKNSTELILTKGKKKLSIKIVRKSSSEIAAPVNGNMTKMIKESINSEVDLTYSDRSGEVFTDHGERAGYEEMEKIFTYFT